METLITDAEVTLDQTVAALRNLSPQTSKIFVDLGYTGHNFKEKGKVFTAKTKKTLSNDDKKMQKRRSAIPTLFPDSFQQKIKYF